jgi:hypothetical protein
MNWQTFKQYLEVNRERVLQFRYAPGKLVDASYHITEIKQAFINSVDCGGVLNKWTEIVVQLWVPEGETQPKAMLAGKALSIINLVETTLQLDAEAIVKIEFGNSQFDTRQMLPQVVITESENIVVDLLADTVQCKAIERGESCGTNDKGEECCTTIPEIKPVLQLKNLMNNSPVCSPGSGCC